MQRYYNQDIGRFTSQDPVFLAVGTNDKRVALALSNPQLLNAYSYVANNPLKYVDEEGEWFKEFLTGQQSWSSFRGELGEAANQLSQQSAAWNFAFDHPALTAAGVGVGAGGAAYLGAGVLTGLSAQYLGGAGTACITFCGQVDKAVQALDYTTRYGTQLGSKMNQVAQNLEGQPYKFSEHSIERIAQKVGVGNESKVLNTLQQKPFEYFHEGANKLGYYNEATKIFVAQAKDSGVITTVINNVSKNYINNLIGK